MKKKRNQNQKQKQKRRKKGDRVGKGESDTRGSI